MFHGCIIHRQTTIKRGLSQHLIIDWLLLTKCNKYGIFELTMAFARTVFFFHLAIGFGVIRHGRF